MRAPLINHKKKFYTLLFLIALNLTVKADSQIPLLDVLKANGSITESQYQQLIQGENEVLIGESEVEHSINNSNGLEVATMDGESSVEIGASLGVDLAYYAEDKNSLGSGTELRFAKISLSGLQNGIWTYQFSVDFSAADIDIDTAYISYIEPFPWEIKIGQFKQPFSLEEQTKRKHSTFMERSLVNELSPGRGIGIGIQYKAIQWNVNIGLFGDEYDSDAADEGDEGASLAGRLVYAPIALDTHVIHFGISDSLKYNDDDKKIKLDARPESHITDLKLFDTGSIKNISMSNHFGVEFAWVSGAWSVQYEYIQLQLNREGNDNLQFSGQYTQISYFLTGESRAYDLKNGHFIRVSPLQSTGAVELAVRLSTLDLDDKDIVGGTGDQLTLGLNWYFTENVKLVLNYSQMDYKSTADADGSATGGDQGKVLQARFLMDF